MLRNQILLVAGSLYRLLCMSKVSAEDVLRTDDPAILGKRDSAREYKERAGYFGTKSTRRGEARSRPMSAARRICTPKSQTTIRNKHGNVRVLCFPTAITVDPMPEKLIIGPDSYVYRADAKSFSKFEEWSKVSMNHLPSSYGIASKPRYVRACLAIALTCHGWPRCRILNATNSRPSVRQLTTVMPSHVLTV